MAKTENKLRIKQVKSTIGCPRNQRETIRTLGLRHINDVAEHADTKSVRGMIQTVRHLVTVEEI